MSKPDYAGVVTGDWHLDRFNRLDDFARCVDFVIDEAVRRKKALPGVPFRFTHVGDGYRTWHPAPVEMSILHRTRCFQDHGIIAEIVVGNHDWPESEENRGIHCFSEMKALGGGMDVIDVPSVKPVIRDGAAVDSFIYIPHVPKAVLERSGMDHATYYAHVLHDLVERARGVGFHAPILFSHVQVKEAVVGPADLTVEGDRQVPVDVFRGKGLTAVFLGDIHKAQKLCDDPPVLYTGSIERVDFGEINDPKGMVYYEVTNGVIRIEFIPTPARKMVQIAADITGETTEEGVLESLERQVKAHDLKDAIVKVTVLFNRGEHSSLDERKLVSMIEAGGAAKIRSISYDVADPRQQRAPEVTESLSPKDALDKWVGMQEWPDTMRSEVAAAGKSVIDVVGRRGE